MSLVQCTVEKGGPPPPTARRAPLPYCYLYFLTPISFVSQQQPTSNKEGDDPQPCRISHTRSNRLPVAALAAQTLLVHVRRRSSRGAAVLPHTPALSTSTLTCATTNGGRAASTFRPSARWPQRATPGCHLGSQHCHAAWRKRLAKWWARTRWRTRHPTSPPGSPCPGSCRPAANCHLRQAASHAE